MVKGIARRVVVVNAPDPKLFEQAIFLLRDDALVNENAPEQVLREAQQVADAFRIQNAPHRKKRTALSAFFFSTMGALLASFVWILYYFSFLA
ncbi:MAG: translation initiation factor 2 [Evtepia sp.]